ncbi:hypothetical protein DSL92_05280 [Billgrantia gudaonensis]|uniref:Diguanylate cyclase n=1 Tax=Billgrantia gudaonensis TaxID=376427 RepID=A0A3S0QFV7_9GAMM|nr:hypothetical protein DSL92_05280 [Halomonas gudaonensis]
MRYAVEVYEFTDRNQQRIPVTTSIGVTQLRQDEPAQEALKRADDALYRTRGGSQPGTRPSRPVMCCRSSEP